VEKADSAIDTMKHLVDHTLLHPFIIDLADPSKVRAAASSFRAKETRLDILVNNAAV
jgi:NAD(P)-dependent dehydrogenase (short-subunit alcohol dehydrogenase family)